MDVFPPMKAFIDFARPKGIKRFVLLSASVFKAGGPAMEQVHQYLIDLGVDYTMLRPSWFMGM
jgi:festuclavine dehydrogenase